MRTGSVVTSIKRHRADREADDLISCDASLLLKGKDDDENLQSFLIFRLIISVFHILLRWGGGEVLGITGIQPFFTLGLLVR